MTDEEFDKFLSEAMNELHEKHDILQKEYGFGSFSRWWYEQITTKLQFFNEQDVLCLEAKVIHIGSYSPKSSTWKWAWSNESILPWSSQRAEKLKELESITGFELFGQESAFKIESESMAWELAAMSVKHLGVMGCYRTPSSQELGPTSFLAIVGVRETSSHAP